MPKQNAALDMNRAPRGLSVRGSAANSEADGGGVTQAAGCSFHGNGERSGSGSTAGRESEHAAVCGRIGAERRSCAVAHAAC